MITFKQFISEDHEDAKFIVHMINKAAKATPRLRFRIVLPSDSLSDYSEYSNGFASWVDSAGLMEDGGIRIDYMTLVEVYGRATQSYDTCDIHWSEVEHLKIKNTGDGGRELIYV